jgi:hypothetical protein
MSAIFFSLITTFFSINAPTPPPGSMVEWTKGVEHDFGLIPRGRPVYHAFVFKNISSDTLRVETVRTTCGCTAAEWTESPIAPGAEGTLSIEYDAYKTGHFQKKIRVFFDRQRKAEFLSIEGEVSP